ncbi:MAG: hypothetical protein JW786_12125 [Desulfobacterales bacterium]|nr:hypothetical protein [Desulfobacterales bacterium]
MENQTAKVSVPKGDKNIKENFLDVTALIRSIQRAEGNIDCFRRKEGYCDRTECAWYVYCIGNVENTNIEGK